MDLSIYASDYLEKTLNRRAKDSGSLSIQTYLDGLKSNKKESELLLNTLQNNFSEFFRNKFSFAYLEHIILPKLIKKKVSQKKKEIRIWSAACASGQEAYSLAILCNELSKSQSTNIRFRIFATDVSETEIQKAKKGIYTETALNNVTLKRVKENFEAKGSNYLINKELKDYINFSTFDLLDLNTSSPQASIFGSFDIVFCSNLLFYYNSLSQKQILDKVDANLVPGGYLFAGEAEKSIIETKCNYSYLTKTSISMKPINKY